MVRDEGSDGSVADDIFGLHRSHPDAHQESEWDQLRTRNERPDVKQQETICAVDGCCCSSRCNQKSDRLTSDEWCAAHCNQYF